MLESELDLSEKRTSKVILVVTQSIERQLLRKYSSFSKLCRVVAYCYRFLSKPTNCVEESTLEKRTKVRLLEVYELGRAEITVLR